jgi:hypothetical protein
MNLILAQATDTEPERRRRVPVAALSGHKFNGHEVYVAADAHGLICYGAQIPTGLLYSTVAGTSYADDHGAPWTFLGVYEIEGITAGWVHLRLLSPIPCVDFDWCRGHDLDEDAELLEPGWHEGARETIGSLNGADVIAYRVSYEDEREEGDDFLVHRTAVFTSQVIDYALDRAGLLLVADDLDRLSKSIRSLARKVHS